MRMWKSSASQLAVPQNLFTKNPFEVAKIVYCISVTVGSFTWRRLNDSKQYVQTRAQVIVTVAYLMVYLCSLYFQRDLTTIYTHGLRCSSLLTLLSRLNILIGSILTISVYLNSLTRVKLLLKSFIRIDFIDQTLQQYGLQEKILDKYRKMRMLTSFTISSYCALIVISAVFAFRSFHFGLVLNIVLNRFIAVTVYHQFYVWIESIGNRFEVVNYFIATKGQKIHDEEQFIAELSTAFSLRCQLKKITNSVNSYYTLQLLLFISLSFAYSVGYGYLTLYFAIGPSAKIIIVKNFYLYLTHICYFLAMLCMVIKSITRMCSAANEFGRIILELKIKPKRKRLRTVIISTSLKLVNDKIEIYACKLIQMDFSLLSSMFVALATYCIVMLQFELNEIKVFSAITFTNSTS
ncbi:hypothetical protein PPYR_05273 [Photinus pyralis]|uniref:Gustatory receptor n=1 Tax=Photinus pyralis TaxID=7054 RepID=A0A5N4AUC8_PHOPY|nr:uncharacterized protein LOC116165950 isoform X1 [Photinus pyralis]KAB0800919.1 hypothetical protein PPYR_05273 [Photinus pyralis]